MTFMRRICIGYFLLYLYFLGWKPGTSLKVKENYDLMSQIIGVNWYLKGNQIRVGLMYQGNGLIQESIKPMASSEVFDKIEHLKLYSMWHY